MGILDHMAILAEPLLSSHLSYASDFGLSLDRLLKTGLTVLGQSTTDCILIHHLNLEWKFVSLILIT